MLSIFFTFLASNLIKYMCGTVDKVTHTVAKGIRKQISIPAFTKVTKGKLAGLVLYKFGW